MRRVDSQKLITSSACRVIGWQDVRELGHLRVLGLLARAFNQSESSLLAEPIVPDTGMIIDGSTTTLSHIKGSVFSGWSSGAWSGQGIALVSTDGQRRIGYAVASAVRANTDMFFMRGPANPATPLNTIEGTDLLVRAVYAGDLNLDDTVNFDDLLKQAQNYNLDGKVWSDGEITYSSDGKIDFDDLLLLAQTYNLGSQFRRGSTPGGLAVYLELQTGAPWILEDVLAHPEGYEFFEPYINGNSGLGARYVTQLQNFNLTNNLVPEPGSLTAIALLVVPLFRRR